MPWQWFFVRRVELRVLTSSWKRNYGYFDLFKAASSARVLQNLTLTQREFVDLWEVRFRPGRSARDLKGAFGIVSASPVASRGASGLVVVRAPFHGFLKRLYFGYGVSFEPPLEFTPETVRATLVGSDAAMSRALTYLRRSHLRFETLSTGAFAGPRADPLSRLTERQREVLEAAFRRGYFDVPSSVTTRALARELGASHQAVADVLHRAERRILSAFLSRDRSEPVSK